MLVWLLQHQKQVKIERLAATYLYQYNRIADGDKYTKILNLDALSVCLIKEILSRQIKPRASLIIALDRTQWKENNILMVSVIYQKSIANILGLTTERRK